ncbi:MAG: DUF3137 domain-containing protein [Alphaproteobacteria bacterium]|nr:DUF3137 domain-containing protein [Alphaproteobacteria bacterium]
MFQGLSDFRARLWQRQRDIPEVSAAEIEAESAFLADAQEKLDVLEELRLEKLDSYRFRKMVGLPAATIVTPVLAFGDYLLTLFHRVDHNDGSSAGFAFLFLFLSFLYWWVTKPKREYAKVYKNWILPDLAKLFGNFSYDARGAIPLHVIQPSKILPRHDLYESEDYFEGTYKDVHIQFSEIDFQQERRSKNGKHYVSVFKGLAVLLDMKRKRFYGHTILDYNRSKMSEWFKEKSMKLKRANLVDPEFEKIFDVYTDDQVEARYLVDPVMMERLTRMYNEYDGNKMAAAFYDSKMLILISSPYNYFEPADLEIPATDPRSILQMKKEIGEILSIIDRLDLYDPNKVHEMAQAQ